MNHVTLILLVSALLTLNGCAQNNRTSLERQVNSGKKVGGGCEGCEAIYESPVAFEKLDNICWMPDWNETGTKLAVNGVVFKNDGKPAAGVIIYVYHTDQAGYYSGGGKDTGWGKRHGRIRGWMKTNEKGEYKFFTLKPAPYPNRQIPAHIHVTIKEPDKNEYWIDEYLFDDDPLLTISERKKSEDRGGNGILKTKDVGNMLKAQRDIYLGRNIPDYPYAGLPKLKSGLEIGANCPAFDPLHLSGADSGKTACPMCKYGYGQGVMVWFNHANLDQLGEFAKDLEKEMKIRGEKKLRVFLVYMNPSHNQNTDKGEEILRGKIRKWCDEQGLKRVAMLSVPSPVDPKTCGLYKINPEAKNTVFVYKKRKIAAKWVNLEYTNESLNEILNQF